MNGQWRRTARAPLEAPLFMDAVLTPHRSLSVAGFRLLFGVFVLMNVIVASVFWLQGAYPVAGFMGLDVAAFALAFHLNNRAAKRAELVQVAHEHVHISRMSPKGADHWLVSPLWARVSVADRGVRIASGKGAMHVGAFLSPREQRDFAKALTEALQRARRGPHKQSTSDTA